MAFLKAGAVQLAAIGQQEGARRVAIVHVPLRAQGPHPRDMDVLGHQLHVQVLETADTKTTRVSRGCLVVLQDKDSYEIPSPTAGPRRVGLDAERRPTALGAREVDARVEPDHFPDGPRIRGQQEHAARHQSC